MLAPTFRRVPLCLLLALSAASCEDNKSPSTVPSPDRAEAASKEAATTTSAAHPAPSSSAEVAAPAAKEPESPAPAANAAGEKAAAEASAAAEKTSDAKAKAPAGGGEKTASSGLLAARNGILPPGAADKVLAVGARPIVKLMNPGGEPRAELTYALDKGAKQPLGMSMDMMMTLRMGDQAPPPITIPKMVMVLDMVVGDRNAQGEWKIDAALGRATVEPAGAQQEAMAKQMRPQIEGMKGLTMNYWVTPKGYVHDVKINIPPNFPAQAQQMLAGMNQSFESMVAPLPAEPVGVGATWEVIARVSSGGADLLQLSTYTLKSKSGARATLDVKVTQLAANDAVNAPGMPAGAKARLRSFSSSGGGASQLDTKSVAPEGGRMDVKSAMEIEVTTAGAGAPQQTSVDTALSVQFTRPAAR